MAKKDKKAKGKKGSGAADTVEAVRSAVERALPEGSKERGSQIVDEVARAVARVRESLEEHKVLDDLKALRNEIEALARRVAALERPGSSAAPAKPAATRTARRSTAKRSTAKRSTAKRSTAKRSTAKRSTTTRKAASSTAKRSTTRKPAASRSRTAKKPSSSS